MNALVERVQMERRMRGWSVRTAAAAGRISNQTWSTFEHTGRVTPGVQLAVVRAFDWPENWQDSPPAAPPIAEDDLAQLRAEILALRQQLAELQPGLDQLGWVVRRLSADDLGRLAAESDEQAVLAALGHDRSSGSASRSGRQAARRQSSTSPEATKPTPFPIAAEGSTGEPRTVGRRVNRPQPDPEE